ncbi:MAG: sodium-dependent transporter [candidate division Zixibacteria bacterium]|nr:sodium-dependent transporter [candidate division Zixibacteria bacterium]MDH3936354.1 sodium-dependent transporter [candidate division Zixibacteria bacterium]
MSDTLKFQPTTSSKRGNWTGHLGFILAATGSAIGLGNIWKFPYITGDYGGGAFVLVYLICVVIVGLPLMVAELIVGRRTQENPVGAFQRLHKTGSVWQATGWLGVASGFLILSFYSIVAGWALAYIFKAIGGFAGTSEQIQAEFGTLVTSPGQSIFWHSLFMLMCVGIVIGGVKRGIERWSKILMPTLFAILLGLMFYGLFFTNGGMQALNFLFKPDFSKLTAEGVLSALGHAFFTLSLGMGCMITYGSYMKRGTSLTRDAIAVSLLDTLVALVAGVAIFSMVFHYGMEPGQSVGLIFKTLPVLFADIGPWISVPFFVLLTFAAVTSGISLLEVVVSYFVDERKWSRISATLVMGASIWLVGVCSAMSSWTVPFTDGRGWFDFFDVLTTNYMLPIGGFLTCLFVAYVMKDADRADEFGSRGTLYMGLRFFLKYITPIAVFVVILHGLELLPFMDYGN